MILTNFTKVVKLKELTIQNKIGQLKYGHKNNVILTNFAKVVKLKELIRT